MRATKYKYSKATKYIPDYDYSQCDQWSMSKEEAAKIFAEANKCMDQDDEDGYYKWISKIPLPPNMALRLRDELGKEKLLASDYNLADAEIVYGKDWIDNYKVDPT